ncbi:MAG: 2-dehydro-3-deoxygalactonokinase [Burkholderiaceae bacterium]
MPAAKHLIALDWGTTSLRAALLDSQGRIVEQAETADGIMAVAGRDFQAVFDKVAGGWRRDHPGAVVLAAGMVGSRQGWHEVPYLSCPAGFDELGRALSWFDGVGGSIGFVPGLATEHAGGAPDVMRGEEIQVFGALDALGVADGIFVLPGTHSKWVRVEDRRIRDFHSYMTGEVYAVLKQHSILSRSMLEGDPLPWEQSRAAFAAGCAAAAQGAVLHNLFSVRSRGLLGGLTNELAPDYLSGVLIGEEIREALALLGDGVASRIHLVCKPALLQRYQEALAVFGLEGLACPEQASYLGMLAIARHLGLLA